MRFDVERLYSLLPAAHRVEDARHGWPLRALIEVLAEQVAVIEEDVDQSYDDLFIETCAEWVVPYIGDLIGVRGLLEVPVEGTAFSRRAEVANTIRLRRRKGTLAALEEIANNVTGWEARAVEFFQLIATTQYLNHRRPHNRSFINIRDADRLEFLGSPFERLEGQADIPHNVDVRRIATAGGRYNIPNIGFFFWRLRPYPLKKSPPFEVDARRRMFSPTGNDIPLFTFPQREPGVTHLARPINVPMPISRRMLSRDLASYYGEGKSLAVFVNDAEVPLEDVVVCDLSDLPGGGGDWAHMPSDVYAVDPMLGRLVVPASLDSADRVTVTHHYGFSMDVGGGEYDRSASLGACAADGAPPIQVDSTSPGPNPLQTALDQVTGGGVVEITDNGRFVETPSITVDPGECVEFRAADETRPFLALEGDMVVNGGDDSRIVINGLLIGDAGDAATSAIRLPASAGRVELVLRDCTLVPGRRLARDRTPQHPGLPSLIIESAGASVRIERCIIGGLRAHEGAEITISDSIIDATDATEVALAGAPGPAGPAGELELRNCTVIGKVHARILRLVSNTILHSRLADPDTWSEPVRADQVQRGCVRFSFVPLAARVPRRHRCQPVDEDGARRVSPQFTAQRYGHPGYCQLSRRCAVEIREGADDRSEMGVFHNLYQPQRETNLRVRLQEYLRFGLEAGVEYET